MIHITLIKLRVKSKFGFLKGMEELESVREMSGKIEIMN